MRAPPAAFAAVANYVVTHPQEPGKLAPLVIEGFGEAMSPAILGFAMLSVASLMMAVGERRAEARAGS